MQNLNLDMQFVHDICIYILYACAVVAALVTVERLIYLAIRMVQVNRILEAFRSGSADRARRSLNKKNYVSRGVHNYINFKSSNEQNDVGLENFSTALALSMADRIEARIWICDTIVTLAPLLGLLGTVLGIMDTFTALSTGGVSDPAAVSRGIAAALLATAIGIGVALFALIGLNMIRRVAESLLESYKVMILSLHTFNEKPFLTNVQGVSD